MNAPPKRTPHAWRDPDGRCWPVFVLAALAWLESSADPADAPERRESGRKAYGRHRVCSRCGVSVVYAEIFVQDAGWTVQPLYGVDLDNLTPMHSAPRCEPGLLSRDPQCATAEAP